MLTNDNFIIKEIESESFGRFYDIEYLNPAPPLRVVRVYPYSTAYLKDSRSIKIRRSLLDSIYNLIPRDLQDNKIVVEVVDKEAFGSATRYAVWFKDFYAMISEIDNIKSLNK